MSGVTYGNNNHLVHVFSQNITKNNQENKKNWTEMVQKDAGKGSVVRINWAKEGKLQDLKQKKAPRFREGLLIWQGRRDSNSRHPVLETGALPTELRP